MLAGYYNEALEAAIEQTVLDSVLATGLSQRLFTGQEFQHNLYYPFGAKLAIFPHSQVSDT